MAALVSTSIPNLINGISQQPAEIRLSSQAERQVNGLSSVARGLEKRPGTEHRARITTTSETDLFIHSIRRDRDEEYTMVLSRPSASTKTLKAYDKNGTEVKILDTTVANAATETTAIVADADLGYLEVTATGGVKDNIVATTVADTTFIINKTKVVAKADLAGEASGEGETAGWSVSSVFKSPKGATLDSGYTHEGLIYVKTGDYSSKYVVYLSLDAASTTYYKFGFQTPSSNVGVNQGYTSTTRLAKIIKDGSAQVSGTVSANGWDSFDSTAPVEGFGGWFPKAGRDENGKETGGAGYEGDTYFNGLDVAAFHTATSSKFKFTLEASSSVIRVQCKEAFSIKTADSHGGKDLVGITTSTQSFSNLPGTGAPDNYLVKIVGNADATQDDFYVKFDATEKTWNETIGPEQDLGFDITTMPHRLVRLYDSQTPANIYFLYETVKEVPTGLSSPRYGWTSRKAGDDTSNPFPSFVGGKINDITFHKNRFGILSDENIIFSVSGNYYNFFPISVMTGLDTNPIDISVSNNEVSILKHAASFDQSLILFSDFQQFMINSQTNFSPNSVSIDVVTQFESTAQAPPVSAGKFVYFPFKRGEYSGVREYFVDTGTADTNDAVDITAHVPQYIKGNITRMVVSSTDQMIAVLSDDDLQRVYVYKNFWEGQNKLQNSWSHWTFDGDILNCAFLGSTLKLLIRRTDGIYLDDINLSLDSAEAVMEDETSVLLDRRHKLTYNQTVAANLPYFADIPSNMVYVTDNARKLTTIADVNEYLTLHSSNVVYAGIPYTFEYEFSRFIHKENELPVQTAKLQIRNINLLYHKTGFFNLKVNVTPGTILIPDPATPGATISSTPRTNYEKNFSGMLTNTSSFGQYKLLSGTFKGSVLTNASNCNIILENDEYLPCAFQSAEWEGFLHQRSRRI